MGEVQTFDPTRHMSYISGNEYLEVKWRLVWLRSVHPNADIETELVSHAQKGDRWEAIFRAKVSLPSGACATGWGTVHSKEFGDYIEKAETKALGRALAALGFGTQFTNEFIEPMVDAPVAPSDPPALDAVTLFAEAMLAADSPGRAVTEEEAKAIRVLMGKAMHAKVVTVEEIGETLKVLGVEKVDDLELGDANTLVSELQAMLDA
jgi:hypothetical protein